MDQKQFFLGDESFVNSIEKYMIKNKINFNKELLQNIKIDNNTIDDYYISQAPNNSEIFVDNIATLGSSTFYILKRIKDIKEKNITLHIINKDLNLHLSNNILFKVLDSLLEIEINRIKHRTDTAKNTRDKKNIKLGRKKGTTLKSKYDKHKKRILHLHKQGVPNTRIVEDINLGTPQSLGKYIKQILLEKKRKQIQKKALMLNEKNLKNINKNFGTIN